VADLIAFQTTEPSPVDGCTGVTMVIAAPSRMEAVAAIRKAGYWAEQIKKSATGSPEAEAALSAPGRILWSEWQNVEQSYGPWRAL
jgi:hypothetical protein